MQQSRLGHGPALRGQGGGSRKYVPPALTRACSAWARPSIFSTRTASDPDTSRNASALGHRRTTRQGAVAIGISSASVKPVKLRCSKSGKHALIHQPAYKLLLSGLAERPAGHHRRTRHRGDYLHFRRCRVFDGQTPQFRLEWSIARVKLSYVEQALVESNIRPCTRQR